MDTKNLTRLIDAYTNRVGLSHWRVSALAAHDGKFYLRIKSGGGCTVSTYNNVAQYLSDHWPLDLPWLADIPRPIPAATSPATQVIVAVRNRGKAVDPALITLDSNGHIADPAAFCAALDVSINSYKQAVRHYADGGSRAQTQPREATATADVLQYLIAAGDARFAKRIALIKKYGDA